MSGRPVVHQFTPVLAGRDAVGAHTLALQRLLSEELECDAAIFAARIHPELRRHGHDFRDHPNHPEADLHIYQAATGSSVADYLATRSETLVIDYHNLTPSSFFDSWSPALAAELEHGRRQLARLAPRVALGLADSAFNASDLSRLGVAEVVVTPVLFDVSDGIEVSDGIGVSDGIAEPDGGEASGVESDLGPALGARPLGAGSRRAGSRRAGSRTRPRKRLLDAPGPVWLFVGRLAPNKAQHDLLAAFAVFRRLQGTGARLVLVGSAVSADYEAALRSLVSDLGLDDAVRFTGSVSGEELAGWYATADVFVCLSDHEGFGVPLMEAMQHDLPVVAFAAGAVPETLADAGLLLVDKSPLSVAAAVQRVLSDRALRERLVARGRQRRADFDPSVTSKLYLEALAPLLGTLTR